MAKSKRSKAFINPAQDELVAVKSDLGLLAGESSPPECRKPRLLARGTSRTPGFHIDPDDHIHSNECCSTSSPLYKALIVVAKIVGLMIFLYLFITSLNLLASSFRLIGGRTASAVFQQSELLGNPVVGLMIGVIVTVIVQSSSTSSSIIVSMVAANFLDVSTAIPIIMGANIGTSVTNTLVSFGQVSDRAQFELAFAGAIVHDMFNWLCVSILLPLEVFTGFLRKLSGAVLSGVNFENQDMKFELLSRITKPLTNQIVKIDKGVLDAWSMNDKSYENATLIKQYCHDVNATEPLLCSHLAAYIGMGDLGTGLLLLFIALSLLCFCLISIVKILGSVLQGSVATVVQRVLNADIPYVPWITGYIAIGIGAVMTFLLQSSSIFTSSLTPLVGLGMISIERVYPLTLGSNLGTTTTALLASLAAEGDRLEPSIQVALVHLFFNIAGMLLFYPIPFTRVPIKMAKALGRVTAKYRWFAVFYMIAAFIILPLLVFGLSMGGLVVTLSFMVPAIALAIFVTSVNLCQGRCPHCLPSWLRTWTFLPLPLRSIAPYDRLIGKVFCCCYGGQNGADPSYSPVGAAIRGGIEGGGLGIEIMQGKSNDIAIHRENETGYV